MFFANAGILSLGVPDLLNVRSNSGNHISTFDASLKLLDSSFNPLNKLGASNLNPFSARASDFGVACRVHSASTQWLIARTPVESQWYAGQDSCT